MCSRHRPLTAVRRPNPYSVPGCTCLADKSELFGGKAQSRLSLGTISDGDETRKRAYEAREEKFARISIYTSRLAAEKARVFSLSCDSGIAPTDIVNAGIINVQRWRFRLFKSQRPRGGRRQYSGMTHSPCIRV